MYAVCLCKSDTKPKDSLTGDHADLDVADGH